MKKLLASLVLGFSLLATGAAVMAQAPAPAAAASANTDTAPAPIATPASDASAPAAAPAAAAPVAAASAPAPAAAPAPVPKLDSGDTAWMLTSTLLVILMTIPGLALFYGGLGRSVQH